MTEQPTRDEYESQFREAHPNVERIEDDDLREKVIEAWVLGLERGGWRHIEDIPYVWNIHEVNNVEHVRAVTEIALEAAELQRELHGADPDMDVLLAACLLHDVGKCYEYVDFVDDECIVGDPDRNAYVDQEIPHSLAGYALSVEVGCPVEVQKAIPHVFGEIPERTLEAEIIQSANSASSNAIAQETMDISIDEWIEEHSRRRS